ncbi:uncharacterized protein LOC133516301 [Cydia pomonella]|uniref:uncharacterized protein LOC133516301 n=1 Tax=Cydia pomonella TaxID=82600 RepID=UPI002ADD84CE|nr:uncharacterized protein LOC133516301 [Cydia pomonella]
MCIRLYFFTLFGIVIARGYFEERKIIKDIKVERLNEIPKKFELKGEHAHEQFQKYVQDINSLARRHNLTVRYLVKVDTKNRFSKKNKQFRTKKYKVPLKKKSMKLSSRELLQRRLAELREEKTERIIITTPKKPVIITTKVPHSGKYRPIINAIKTNYTKVIRPVKSKIVTIV